jgi:hypothetical protein
VSFKKIILPVFLSSILLLQTTTFGTAFSQTSQDEIPDWIKNNADWWSKGLITDRDFATGLGFMVQSGIIEVDNVEFDSEGSVALSDNLSIPKWIRTSADWWATGKIPDGDFKLGVQYMIQEEIISFKDQSQRKISPPSLQIEVGSGDENVYVGSMELDKNGGTLVSEDKKFRIEFPENAVLKPVQVSITNLADDQITEDMKFFGPLGSIYELEPDGLVLETPATITTIMESDSLPNYELKNYDVPLIILLSRSSDGQWELLEEFNSELQLDTGKLVVSGKASHFSDIVKSDRGVYARITPMDIQSNVGDIWGAKVRVFLSPSIQQTALRTFELGHAEIDYYGFKPDKVAHLSDTDRISSKELQSGKAIEKTGLWVCLDETEEDDYGAVISGTVTRKDTIDFDFVPEPFDFVDVDEDVKFSIKVNGVVECLPIGSPITATGTGKTPGNTGVGLSSMLSHDSIIPEIVIEQLGDHGKVEVKSQFHITSTVKVVVPNLTDSLLRYDIDIKGDLVEEPLRVYVPSGINHRSNDDVIYQDKVTGLCLIEGPEKFSYKINIEWELSRIAPVYLKGERIGYEEYILKSDTVNEIIEGTVTCVASDSESSTGTTTEEPQLRNQKKRHQLVQQLRNQKKRHQLVQQLRNQKKRHQLVMQQKLKQRLAPLMTILVMLDSYGMVKNVWQFL